MVKNMTAEQGRTKEIVLFGLFTALTAIGAFIRIPVPVCPFTLQLLFTTLAGLILGSRRGARSVLLHLRFRFRRNVRRRRRIPRTRSLCPG